MDDIKKVEKFNYFEKLYLRVTLGILGLSISLFILTMYIVTEFSEIPKSLINFTILILYLSAAGFIMAIVRIIKYIVKISKLDNNIGIARTIVGFFLSPVSFAILFILVIMMSLSSCTVQ